LVTSPQNYAPRRDRDRLDHARNIQNIFESNIYGLTIDQCIEELYVSVYGSTMPTDLRLEYEREETK